MPANTRKNCFGADAGEDCTIFVFDLLSSDPIQIENIGITHPNPNYYISREASASNVFVFEYVVSGKGYVEINGETHTVRADDVYCIQPGTAHKYYSDPIDPYRKIWINVYSDFLGDVFRRFRISDRVVFPSSNCRRCFDEFLKLREISLNSSAVCYKALAIILDLLCTLADGARIQHDDDDRPRTSEVAFSVKRFLDQSIYSSATIGEIANALGYDKAHIIREFEKYYGETPYQYLLSRKILIAKKLLTVGEDSVTDISEKLSFSNVYYFSRIFKKKTGMSPSEFRARNS